MLEKVYHFFNKLDLGAKFGRGSTLVASEPDCCSVSVNAHEIKIVHARRTGQQVEIQLLETLPYRKADDIPIWLSGFVKKHQLEGMRCSWILHSSDYQTLLLDALPVTEAEFQQAIRWKIKDLVNFPIEDAVIDSFPMPPTKMPGAKDLITVVVSRASYLQPIANKILASGLRLDTIDISKLALRNINTLFETDQKTIALIYVREKGAQLIITKENLLYFYRDFEIKIEDRSAEECEPVRQSLEKIALELQRSFDYYQSQWRAPMPARYFLASDKLSTDSISAYLSNLLALTIEPLNLKDVIAFKQPQSIQTQGKFLPLIGGIVKRSEGIAK